jgi:hypothetical protein
VEHVFFSSPSQQGSSQIGLQLLLIAGFGLDEQHTSSQSESQAFCSSPSQQDFSQSEAHRCLLASSDSDEQQDFSQSPAQVLSSTVSFLAEQHSFLHSTAHDSWVEEVPFEQDNVAKITNENKLKILTAFFITALLKYRHYYKASKVLCQLSPD